MDVGSASHISLSRITAASSTRSLHGIQPLDLGVESKGHRTVSRRWLLRAREETLNPIEDPDPNKQFSKIEQDSLFQDGKLHPSITVIGRHPARRLPFLQSSLSVIHKVTTSPFRVKWSFSMPSSYRTKNLAQARKIKSFYRDCRFLSP